MPGIHILLEMPESMIAENNDQGWGCRVLPYLVKQGKKLLVGILEVFDIVFLAMLVSFQELIIWIGLAISIEIIRIMRHH